MKNLPDWSALDHDLLGEIAVRVPLIEDFMAFRGVCSTWRSSAAKNKFKPLQCTIPLLLLQEETKFNDEVPFYSLSRRKICMRLSLPQLLGRKCIGARFGWLFVLDSNYRADEVSLFNPLSGAQIKLPNLTKMHEEDYRVKRAVLSADPSRSSNFVLMVSWTKAQGLGVYRAGEESWTVINRLHDFIEICSIFCYICWYG